MASRSRNDSRRNRDGGSREKFAVGLSKAASQEIHARRAAEKRYGVDVGLLGICEIREQIQLGNSRCLERQSNRVTIHQVKWGGKTMVAVYDSIRHTLVTFLPEDFKPGERPWQ